MPRQKQVILRSIADNAGDGLSITNDTSFDWNNVTFTLDGQYEGTWPLIRAHETVLLKYSEVKDKEGNLFPAGQAPSRYFIESDEGTGPA